MAHIVSTALVYNFDTTDINTAINIIAYMYVNVEKHHCYTIDIRYKTCEESSKRKRIR